MRTEDSDQARYADSNGYSIDSGRAMWPWRDWVIDAINRDLPFDLADASVAVLAEEQGIEQALTVDTDFDVYRDRRGRPLRNLLAGVSRTRRAASRSRPSASMATARRVLAPQRSPGSRTARIGCWWRPTSPRAASMWKRSAMW